MLCLLVANINVPQILAKTEDKSIVNVQYAYVEKPYLNLGEIQNIVISLNENVGNEREIILVVQKDDNTVEEWECSKNVGSLYLFSKEYTDMENEGTYKCIALKSKKIDVELEISLSKMNALVEFGVNQEYEGYGEHVVALNETAEMDVDTSVVRIDENGQVVTENDIESALQNAIDGTSSYSLRRSSNIIVALDPGHDNRHGGATANGLIEQDLTLKIANYCKAELETYEGLEVYMTRTSNECPYPDTTSSGKCIEQRVFAAVEAGASIYVSFHLNASESTSASGAEIIYPNSNWKEEIGIEGEKLAQSIQDELVKLGLKDRKIYSKDTSVNEKYPDGSLSDYFAVQIYNKEQGIPGIIVEHAFITNGSDVNNFLKTEAGLKKLGVADATGIANYLGVRKEVPFTDVAEDAWYYEVVKYVYKNGLMTGYNETTFGPDSEILRAEFVTILHRMNGSPTVEDTNKFPDVSEGEWYTKAVLWANSEGIVSGYTHNGCFGPMDNITREQMAVMMYNYARKQGYDTSAKSDLSKYSDESNVSEYANEAMKWAVGSGIIEGENGGTQLNPNEDATRAECAAIIVRFVEEYK